MIGLKSLVNWLIASAVWISGALALWVLWQYQKALPDPAASFIEFAVMFLATFYLLALFAIKHTVDSLCGYCELPDPIPES